MHSYVENEKERQRREGVYILLCAALRNLNYSQPAYFLCVSLISLFLRR
jgi:hypothetical protein